MTSEYLGFNKLISDRDVFLLELNKDLFKAEQEVQRVKWLIRNLSWKTDFKDEE